MTSELYTQHLMSQHGVAWFKFDETSGNVLDSKGSAVGTVNGATRVTGWNDQGTALSFDGVDDYIQFNNIIIPTGEKTFKFKIYPISFTNKLYPTLFSNRQTGTGWIAHLLSDGSIVVNFSLSNFSVQLQLITNPNSLQLNKWQEVIITYDNKNVSVYVDNELVGKSVLKENIDTGQVFSNNLRIGLDENVDGYGNFILDDFEVYNKALHPNDFIANKLLLVSSDEIKSIEIKTTENLIPTMTSATTPSGSVFSSSVYGAGNEGWRVFDGVENSSWATSGTNVGHVGYIFDIEKVVNAYAVISDDLWLDRTPKHWTFEGSNDGVNWIILDTQINQTGWAVFEKRKYFFNNENPYKRYRINITSVNGGTNVQFNELEMYETKGILNTLPSHSEKNLITYGMESHVQLDEIFTNKNYILQDTVSEDVNGLWTTQINRKPLSIKLN